ncbi:hypothetical protein AKO1_007633 [Acrasis kona]|uniref:C3H1-type domain-containing protein n=1 Tax=Acrasis kona TaxID=1008807 RepID=A0AAW2YQX1_9EUKA
MRAKFGRLQQDQWRDQGFMELLGRFITKKPFSTTLLFERHHFSPDSVGESCEFRHSEEAKKNPRECKFWQAGECTNKECIFRHGTKQVKRVPTPCYYFSMGKCTRGATCPFLHATPASSSFLTSVFGDQQSIQPSSDSVFGSIAQNPQPTSSTFSQPTVPLKTDTPQKKPLDAIFTTNHQISSSPVQTTPTSIIPPSPQIIVRFDAFEDFESCDDEQDEPVKKEEEKVTPPPANAPKKRKINRSVLRELETQPEDVTTDKRNTITHQTQTITHQVKKDDERTNEKVKDVTKSSSTKQLKPAVDPSKKTKRPLEPTKKTSVAKKVKVQSEKSIDEELAALEQELNM